MVSWGYLQEEFVVRNERIVLGRIWKREKELKEEVDDSDFREARVKNASQNNLLLP